MTKIIEFPIVKRPHFKEITEREKRKREAQLRAESFNSCVELIQSNLEKAEKMIEDMSDHLKAIKRRRGNG